ncbi:MAG: hypothetical protein Q4D89_13335 [Arachnia propionica]|uniref:hypothetical protein n=1 Tax=Arachnia propionica TaxID=1750 RepID=UPI00270F6FA4|nr:hypothetical protein [Arachnia propionica]
MNHLPFHTAHHWITRLAQLPHPITINHIPPLAMDFSWEPANHINGYIYKENSTTTLIQILSSKKTGCVFSITFSLAKSRPPTLSGSLNLVEFYPSCLNEAKNSWGPQRTSPQTQQAASGSSTITLIFSSASIQIKSWFHLI